MSQTTNVIIPVLSWLVSTGGAGFVASLIFDKARTAWAVPSLPAWAAKLLHAPRYARWTVMLLATFISVGASALLALMQGQDVLVSVDAAFAASLSVIVSQIKHSFRQSTHVSESDDERNKTRSEPRKVKVFE
jgi:endonuclease/exonuclease/phosphatase (EEP) superfamily protein YafD